MRRAERFRPTGQSAAARVRVDVQAARVRALGDRKPPRARRDGQRSHVQPDRRRSQRSRKPADRHGLRIPPVDHPDSLSEIAESGVR